jgi:hypothetical protein
MSDQQVPQAPNYSPLIAAMTGIANTAAANGQTASDWAKAQIAGNQNLVNQVNSGLLNTQGTFDQAAQDKLNSSGQMLSQGDQNLRDQYAKYTDPTRKAADMGAAEADVGAANDAARDASTRELESYGINPGATRFAALDIGARLQDAAARAGAGNVASRTDDALADQTNQQIVAQGNAEAGQANTNAATAGGAGTGAVSAGLGQTASGTSAFGNPLGYTAAQTGALSGAVNTTNTGFQNQADADKIANSSSSGFGSLLGIGASMLGKGGALASGGALSFLAEGGAVDDIAAANGGGAVPVAASPSRGAVTDDIPAVAPGGPARLNGGEFVLPKDVVSWKGEEFLQKLIQQARTQKQAAVAKPQVGAVPA